MMIRKQVILYLLGPEFARFLVSFFGLDHFNQIFKGSCLVGWQRKRDFLEFFVENLMYIYLQLFTCFKKYIYSATLSNFVIEKY